jgi:hypothetical protein
MIDSANRRPRLHPLSAYSRTEIWDRLQHFFENEPDLPKPHLEPNAKDAGDIEICARLIEAFSLERAYERSNVHPEKQPNEGVWEELKAAHSEAYHLLQSKNAAGLADYLRNGLRTTLCSGLGSGPATFQIMSGEDWRDPVLQLIDSLASLAEAVGALPYENPIIGSYGQNINLGILELTEAIESKLRFLINRPKVMGIYGIGHHGGVIDVRVPDDAYCAHRIRLISNDVSRTRFIEIGGGFGGMALFALRAGVTYWAIVDLPIINVVQGYFLIKCLGGNAVRLFGEHNQTASVEVLPYWEFFNRDRNYSVVFSRWALQEIPRNRVDEYLAEIETRGTDLLSINHEAGSPTYLNLHQIISEHGKLKCRLRHPYWIRKGYVEELFKR